MAHCSAISKVRTKLFFMENIYYVSAFVSERIAQEPALKFQSSDKASRGSFITCMPRAAIISPSIAMSLNRKKGLIACSTSFTTYKPTCKFL